MFDEFVINNGVLEKYTGEGGVVVIPESVMTIGADAFSDCSSLTSVTIPNSVTKIGNGAFYKCNALSNIMLPSSVVEIGEQAFCRCSALTSMTIPSGLKKISDGLFYKCNKLKNITIPDSVTEIGTAAFSGCSALTSVTIPSNVTMIGVQAFRGCSALISMMLPSCLETISDGLFSECNALTNITIPDVVTEIGCAAFSGCSALTSVTIPASVTEIGEQAFYGCSSLTSLTISYGVKAIGNAAFYSCEALTSAVLPDSLSEIGVQAFYGCSSLTSMTIPASVTHIRKGAFRLCNSLQSVTICNGVMTIGEEAFAQCSSLTSVTIPDSMTEIGNYAFYDCKSLISIAIPDGIKVIGKSTFSGCSLLLRVTLGKSVTTIGENAFHGCTELTKIIIPDGLETIGNYAFEYCSSLTSLTIPDSVNKIGDQAFYYCSSLKRINIPNSVLRIGKDAFSECRGLADDKGFVIVREVLIRYYNHDSIVVIPDGVTEISASAFKQCYSLISVTIPASVKQIGYYAFYGCGSMTSVSILGSVTSIGFKAFEGCKNLETVICPHTPFSLLKEQGLGMLAAKGFILEHQKFNNPAIVSDYISYISSQRKKLLPMILLADDVEMLKLLADAKKITKKNLEQDYLLPAKQCKAEKCTVFLEELASSMLGAGNKLTVQTIEGRELWDGTYFSIDGKTLLKYKEEPGITEYEVPGGIKEIATGAFQRTSLKTIRLPESVTTIRRGAFSSSDEALLCIYLPAGLKKMPVDAVEKYDCCIISANRDIVNRLCEDHRAYCIYTGGPLGDLTPRAKNYAVMGFLCALNYNLADMSPWRDSYFEHIRRNEKTYIKQAVEVEDALEDDFLLHLMIDEKMLSEKNTSYLLEVVGKMRRADLTAILLEYKSSQFAKTKDTLSLSDDDPEMKRMLKMQERREQIKNQKGIAGLAFVATGDFDNFGYVDEYTGEHYIDDLKKYIEERGGHLRSAVSSKTDYLICNDPNSKTVKSRKAKELGVTVITEAEFLKMADEKEW